MTNESRVAAGIPTGGQFAAQNRTEADTSLDQAAEEKTFTVFGYWENDELVVDFVSEGEVEDTRDEWVHGLQSFCASVHEPSAEAAERAVLQEYDPRPETEANPIFEQLRSDPELRESWVLDEYVRAIDEYVNSPETEFDEDGDLRLATYHRVRRCGATRDELATAQEVLERLIRVRAL
tara:strand:- start:20894 stop:21430 length:537 start_codon:yes stop_codon:yes gene_type:complete